MKTWVRRTARIGILSAGFLLLGSTASHAADLTQVSAGNDGVANGTQVQVPVQVPVNVSGVGVGVLGIGNGNSNNSGAAAVNEDYTSTSHGGAVGVGAAGVGNGNEGGMAREAARTESADDGQASVDNDGLLNGTQVQVPIQVPVNACGIGVGVLGIGNGNANNCGSAAVRESVNLGSARTESADDGQASVDNDGVLNGTQVQVPIQVPVNVCGIGVGVLGIGNGNANNCGAAAVRDGGHEGHDGHYGDRHNHTMPAREAQAKPAHEAGTTEMARNTEGAEHVVRGSADDTQISADNDGVLNGTQVQVPVQVPVNVSGIGVGVLGIGDGNSNNSGSAAVR